MFFFQKCKRISSHLPQNFLFRTEQFKAEGKKYAQCTTIVHEQYFLSDNAEMRCVMDRKKPEVFASGFYII